MYEYLLGDLLALLFWLLIFGGVPRLRPLIVWGSLTHVAIPVGLFFIWKILSQFIPLGVAFVPAYWNPPMLFDLGARFGLGIEDVLFLFAMGGIGTACYELFTKHSVREKKKPHAHWGIIVVFALAFLVMMTFRINPIYAWAGANIFAALYIVLRRKDLLRHAVFSGLLYTGAYTIFFWLILLLFPWFVQYWSFGNLSGLVLLGIPLEEYLWAFSFGLLWGPLYEYVRHAKLR